MMYYIDYDVFEKLGVRIKTRLKSYVIFRNLPWNVSVRMREMRIIREREVGEGVSFYKHLCIFTSQQRCRVVVACVSRLERFNNILSST